MNETAPFQASDLEELDARLLSLADRVVPMRDVYKGDAAPRVIGLRHDVDDNEGSFETALRFARWEFERGYSSTYFLLHGSHYWDAGMFEWLPEFEELGHEVGVHVNAIAEGLRQRRDPHVILAEAIAELRSSGVRIVGSVAHGDALCHSARFVNDELFEECRREEYGDPRRLITWRGVVHPLEPRSFRLHGLEYESNWLPRGLYLSESGGRWSTPLEEIVEAFGSSQLHVLLHPDWWSNAFVSERVAA